MNELKIFKLAKQGNVEALTTFINNLLQPEGITAKTDLKDGYLKILLESSQVLNQQALALFIGKIIITLEAQSIQQLKIYGKKLGNNLPIWAEEIDIKSHANLEKCEIHEQCLKSNSTIPQPEQKINLTAESIVRVKDPHKASKTEHRIICKREKNPEKKPKDTNFKKFLYELIEAIANRDESAFRVGLLGFIENSSPKETLGILEQALIYVSNFENSTDALLWVNKLDILNTNEENEAIDAKNRQQIQQYLLEAGYELEIDFIVSVNGSIRLLSIEAIEALREIVPLHYWEWLLYYKTIAF